MIDGITYEIRLMPLSFDELTKTFDYDVTVVNKTTNRLASKLISGGVEVAGRVALKLLQELG